MCGKLQAGPADATKQPAGTKARGALALGGVVQSTQQYICFMHGVGTRDMYRKYNVQQQQQQQSQNSST